MLEDIGVTYDDWDLLLFGDGSGMTWEIGGGFASFLIDRATQIRKHLIGARTLSTVNRMELSAYTEALSYHFEAIMKRKVPAPYRTLVITDSELTARVGNRVYSRKANGDLWQAIDWFTTRGYRITWQWVNRNSTPFHEMADYLAGAARRGVMELKLADNEPYDLLPYTVPEASEPDDLVVCAKCLTPLAPGSTECLCGAVVNPGGIVEDDSGLEESEESQEGGKEEEKEGGSVDVDEST